MSIDFSKAPEGATHYRVNSRGITIWYREKRGGVHCRNAGESDWFEIRNARLSQLPVAPIPAPELAIDFSKAPEGATHYMPTTAGINWYSSRDGNALLWRAEGWTPSGVLLEGPLVLPIPTAGSNHDPVDSPSHYASGGVECIDAIRASMTPEAFLGYLKGNVQKYIFRYEKKANPSEDLKKARWYLERLIKEVSSEVIS